MSTQKQFSVLSIQELKQVSEYIISQLCGRDVVLLNGPMGVGKTELVRSLVTHLHGSEISSPSFAIHNNYSAGPLSIDHLDLFRIEGEDDLESTGFWDLFNQKSGLIILEWAEKLEKNLIPRQWKTISVDLQFADSSNRKITVSN